MGGRISARTWQAVYRQVKKAPNGQTIVTVTLLALTVVLAVEVVQQSDEISRLEHEVRCYEEYIDRQEAPVEDGIIYLFDVPSGCEGVLNVSRSARDKVVIEDGEKK